MAWHAIVHGRQVLSTDGSYLPAQPFEFYQHVHDLLELLKQAFLAFCCLLSALTWVAPTLFLSPLL